MSKASSITPSDDESHYDTVLSKKNDISSINDAL